MNAHESMDLELDEPIGLELDDPPGLDLASTDLALAVRELHAFREGVTDGTRVRRLAAECAWHPMILLASALRGLALGLWTGGMVVLLAPFTGHQAAVALSRIDPARVLGPAWLVVAACAAIAATSARKAAAFRGDSSPLLPEEARVHQRLAGEVLRLRCQERLERAA